MPQYLSPGVYVEEVDSGSRPIEGVGTAVAAFVGQAASGPFNTPTLVSNWTQYTTTFGDFMEGSYLGHAVYGYMMNGGGNAYVVRVGGSNGSSPLPTARAELTTGTPDKPIPYRIEAIESGAAGNDLSVEVNYPDGGDESTFNLVIKVDGKPTETHENLTIKKGKQNAVTVVNAASTLIRLEEVATGTALERPAAGPVALAGGDYVPAPSRLEPDDYVGDVAARTGFSSLEAVEEVTMLSVPDLTAAFEQGALDLEGFKAVQLAMIAHCELMGDRMAILDPPPSLNAQQIKDWRVNQAGYDSRYATLYWPRIKVLDPLSGTNVYVPPSGHMAGIWARNDDTRGVHKAPANEVIRGAISLELNLTKGE
ncbi:MAG: phage tail sheath subtilisin-like domain-containing protein, partial [Acidimicrobiia bacterium]